MDTKGSEKSEDGASQEEEEEEEEVIRFIRSGLCVLRKWNRRRRFLGTDIGF